MTAIQNQQTGLDNIIAIATVPINQSNINTYKISEHNRKLSTESLQSGSDVALARGINKRYIRNNKKSFSLSFIYLPSSAEKTVDGKRGRDYLSSIAQTKDFVYVMVKLHPDDDYESFQCYVTSYTEKLIRRDILNQCSYYDVSIQLEEM